MRFFRILNNNGDRGIQILPELYCLDDDCIDSEYAIIATNQKSVGAWAAILNNTPAVEPFSMAKDSVFLIASFEVTGRGVVRATTDSRIRSWSDWDITPSIWVDSEKIPAYEKAGYVEYVLEDFEPINIKYHQLAATDVIQLNKIVEENLKAAESMSKEELLQFNPLTGTDAEIEKICSKLDIEISKEDAAKIFREIKNERR